MLSTWQKCEKVTGLLDEDMNDWERGFVASIQRQMDRSSNRAITLSEKQIESLDRIHDKHFA